MFVWISVPTQGWCESEWAIRAGAYDDTHREGEKLSIVLLLYDRAYRRRPPAKSPEVEYK